MDHEGYMRRAIALCEEKMAAGEGGYCATLIVRDDEVIGEGWNNVAENHDATGHCEINAIRDAGQAHPQLGPLGLDPLHDLGALRPCARRRSGGRGSTGCSTAISSPTRPTSASTSPALDSEVATPSEQRGRPYRRLLGDETYAMFRAWWDSGDRTTI